uniref:Endonuclease/exonuclease/phosphatase n=1 Tax=Solanum tuberosum TaxID=4113 RepID=M1DVR4_SOLTU
MNIEGQLMRIQTWTPDFTPEEETPIVPIWVALPELPWHCYNKVVLTTILSSIGKVLYLDSPSSQKTRGSMARVKIQIDLTKERPPHVWLGFKNSDPNKGRWQKIQYEGIPDYCHYCKHQGHVDNVCTIKRRDEEFQRRKELEAEKKNKTKGEQEKGTNKNQVQDHGKSAAQVPQQTEQREDCRLGETTTQVQIHQEQEVGDQEEHWQIQRKKQNKNQEQSYPKTAWRPVSPQKKGTKNSKQQETQPSGILPTILNQNNYINLEMQELQDTNTDEEGNSNRTVGQGHQTMQESDKDPSIINFNNNTPRKQVVTTEINNTPGIDSLIPTPNPQHTTDINAAEEADGGMEERIQETHTNLQEGVSKGGRELTHVLHEVETYDHRIDSRAPATPVSTQRKADQYTTQEKKKMTTEPEQQRDRTNNKSGGRLSKKKRDAMKKRQGKRGDLEQGLPEKGQQLEKQTETKSRRGDPYKMIMGL